MPKALRQHKRNELELGWCKRFFQRSSCLESVLKFCLRIVGIVYAICNNFSGLWCINTDQYTKKFCKKVRREKSEDEKSAEPFLGASQGSTELVITATDETTDEKEHLISRCQKPTPNVSRCQKLWGEIRETNLNKGDVNAFFSVNG